jgi:hypothetical protein
MNLWRAMDDDSILRNALAGDPEAIAAHLLNKGIDPAIAGHVRAMRTVETTFECRVRAIVFYRQRRAAKIAKHEILNEMASLFALPSNVLAHLADGDGYTREQSEAIARIRAEANPTKLLVLPTRL